jgi:hypothetical protein
MLSGDSTVISGTSVVVLGADDHVGPAVDQRVQVAQRGLQAQVVGPPDFQQLVVGLGLAGVAEALDDAALVHGVHADLGPAHDGAQAGQGRRDRDAQVLHLLEAVVVEAAQLQVGPDVEQAHGQGVGRAGLVLGQAGQRQRRVDGGRQERAGADLGAHGRGHRAPFWVRGG